MNATIQAANKVNGSALQPKPGEAQSQFFERAMGALRKTVPSINRRTVQVLEVWCASPNAEDRELREIAAAHFPRDKFKHYKPRCIFIEHTIPPSSDGTRPEITYDKNALQKLVNFANYRIANSQTFSAISNDHTPSQDEKLAGLPMPEVLGYCGPFYLALMGDKDPVWAIYADEWVHNSDVDKFEKLQRRSPEVWTSEPIETRTMDPIAALGASTPRLDSGMNPYSRASDGQTVMKYSSATFAGPTNTFVPTAGGKKNSPHRYSGDSPMAEQPGTDDLQKRIGDAITALLPTFVSAVCEAINGENADVTSDDDLAGDMDNDIPGEEPGNNPQDMGGSELQPRGLQQTNSDTQQNEGGVNTPGANPTTGQDDDERKYAAMGGDPYAGYCAGKKAGMAIGGKTNYSRGSGEVDKGLREIVARQQNELNALRDERAKERQDLIRYSRLSGLAKDYAFDVEEEMKTVIGLNDEQYERHCTSTIAKYAKRDDVTGVELYIDPAGTGGGPNRNMKPGDADKYSREAAHRAALKNHAAKKTVTTFEAEWNEVLKEHGISA